MVPSSPQREFALEVVRRLVDTGYEALWAGGCVRDELLGNEPDDYDVATSATPDEVREVFGRRRTMAVGESFGVIIVRGPRGAGSVEVATFRTDLDYEDGRRPTGVVFSTAEEDAQRRDFTINGMFHDPLAERVIDFVGGEADLAAGVIRAIGEPRDRIREDKLRMLRAVRFAARFGFELDPNTAEAIHERACEIGVVSVERITAELRRMLAGANRSLAVRLLWELGLLAEILPEAATSYEADTTGIVERLDAPTFEAAFAGLLLHTDLDPGPICRRLRFSNDETARVGWLLGHVPAVERAPSLPLHELKPMLTHDGAAELLSLARAANIAGVSFCEDYLRDTPHDRLDPPPLVNGGDLVGRGLEPGPRFKELLSTIRDRQLDEELTSRDEALAALDDLV